MSTESLMFSHLDIPKIRSLVIPPISWIVPGMIVDGGFHVIAGVPGSMKSMLALYIAGRVSAGVNVFDSSIINPRRVVYVDKENPPHLVQDRFRLLGINDESNLHYWNNWPKYVPVLPPGIVEGAEYLSWAKEHKTKEQRREILDRFVRSILNNREEMEKFREQLDGDAAKNGEGHINNAA
jgi:hypothetical protein